MLTHDTLTRLCRARNLLRQIGDDAPTIDEVAREAAMSPFHFIRRFAAVFGETPHQFRIRARLEHAKALLAAGNASVTDVCMAVGFSSLGSFSDLFSRRVGVAPSVYRRTARPRVRGGAPERPAPVGCFALMGGEAGLAIFEKRAPTAGAQY